jgi:hypothetical protein
MASEFYRVFHAYLEQGRLLAELRKSLRELRQTRRDSKALLESDPREWCGNATCSRLRRNAPPPPQLSVPESPSA